MQKQQSTLTVLQPAKIPEQSTTTQGVFPIVYTPKNYLSSHITLQEHISANKSQLLKQVNQNGAMLFRDFNIKSPNEATSVLNQFGLKSFKYIGGAAVRKLIIGSEDRQLLNTPQTSLELFTTNQAPPNKPIPFHNQLLQTHNYPEYIAFYCYSAAEEGGATPILSCTNMYEYINEKHSDFLTKLKQVGVKYQRVVGKDDNPESPIGRGWAGIFNVKTKEQAEIKMKEQKFQWEWLENGDDCRLSSGKLNGVIKTKSGVQAFTNQILAVFKGWVDDKNTPEKCLKFGDGSDMPMQVLADIYAHAEKIQVSIPWQSGDLIIIDNEMAMHAREPFTGPHRRIFACLMQSRKQQAESLTSHMPTQVLNTGYQLPLIGFGTWKIPKQECVDVVYKAIKSGYRLFDCACDYGNEKQVGQGIQKAIKEGLVTRKQLFITSKLWNTYHRPEHVELALNRTISDLGVDYLDLYLIHFPISLKFIPFEERYPPEWVYDTKSPKPYMKDDPVPITDTWKAMEGLVEKGLVRNIGVSNFKVALLRQLLYSCKIKPAVLQVELHPELTQKKLLRYCREQGIQVTSFSTFGASSYIELGMATESDPIFKNQLIIDIASQYQGRSPHQVILRWAVQQGIAIIPKSIKEERMKENINIVSQGFVLTDEHMKQIDNLNKDRRYNDPGHFCELAFGTFFPIHE